MPEATQLIPKGDRALTLREAYQKYGIPEHRLRQCRAEKEIDFFKIGRALFVSETSLLKFLEAHRQASTA